MIITTTTIKMKTIFKTINEFIDYLTNDLRLEGDFKTFIAPYIYYYFINSNINYDTIEAFKRHLGITIKNIYKRYEREHALIEASYSLTEKELSVVSKVVNITANNDNTKVLEPLDNVLEFISTQNVSEQTSNKLESYYNAIDKLSDDVIDEFIDSLRNHFITVLYDPEFIICEEEEEHGEM